MIKKITCKKCCGLGKVEVEICDACGKEERCGDHEKKRICEQCWAATLSDEEIKNL